MKGTSSTVCVKQLFRSLQPVLIGLETQRNNVTFLRYHACSDLKMKGTSSTVCVKQLFRSLHPLPIPSPSPSCLLGLENETFGQVVLAVGYHTPRSHVHDECPYVSEPYIDVFTGYFRMLEAFKYSVREGR
jgi:hypothetical protein